MKLQKFGVKLFLEVDKNYSSKEFIPVFHSWIQDKTIDNHLLIDVADYSHMIDGPGIMLIAHEGHFSLDQENSHPGMMYMRKKEFKGNFYDRFYNVFKTAIMAAKLLRDNSIINRRLDFISDSFRFIANDRLYAENTLENQNLYKNEIQNALNQIYPNSKVDYKDFSSKSERLSFSIKFIDGINILE